MFVDRVEVVVEGGVGGSGAEAFRRESGVPRGGPSGGDGGRGGSVILIANPQLTTLLDFRYRPEYRAERGQHGSGSDKTGRSGKDLELGVPAGTVVRDAESGEVLGELLREGDRMVVAKGGRGGRGNAGFATATRQAPTRWEPGEEGERRKLELELKLLADVGLVGKPNAGKSTFLAASTEARPRIADYPFTTLSPNLGVASLSDYRQFLVADIPGIIEGAHEGKGLGLQFLRHIERTRTLAFLVPVDSDDPQGEYDTLRGELHEHSEALGRRPHCLVLTKTDLLPPDHDLPDVHAPEAWGVFPVSAVARTGMTPLLEALWSRVREGRLREDAAAEAESRDGGTSEGQGSGPVPEGVPDRDPWEELDGP